VKEFDRPLHIHEAQHGRLQEWEQRLRNQEREMPKKLKAAKEEGHNSENGKTALTKSGTQS